MSQIPLPGFESAEEAPKLRRKPKEDGLVDRLVAESIDRCTAEGIDPRQLALMLQLLSL